MVKDDSLIEKGVFLYPIQISWQTVFEQNNRRFYMHIIEGNELNEMELGYRRIGSNIDMMGAGIEYMSSFFGEFKKKRALFVQTIEKDNCKVSIYSLEYETIFILGKTPDDVWKNIGLYKKFCGTQLFGLEHSLTQKIISDQNILNCTPSAWNNEILMNNFLIIELQEKLRQLYLSQYEFSEHEICAWKTMQKHVDYEFWSHSSISDIDQNTLQLLYDSGFLRTIPNYIIDISSKFWKCFQKSLNENKNGIDGKIQILSIIVSSKTIAKARAYCNINGPGCLMYNKPTITRVRISEEINKYGLPLKYLKDQKETLWQKYFELYPNGIKRTIFLTRLRDGPYCYKNDLGGLCLTCAEYSYNIFDDLKELINKRIIYKNEQIAYAIKHYVQLGYNINERENIVEAIKNIKGTSVANIQPNRNYKGIKKPKLSGISNWFEFKWPIEEELIGFICARALPHFGTWNNFSPAVINKSRDEIEQLCPDPTRLLISEIKKELDQRSLEYDAKENRGNLINLLKANIQQETSTMIKEMNDTHELYIVVDDEALKENQIYRKKGGGKCMTETVKEILKSFFHAGDEDKNILQDLQQREQMGELETEEIPQLKMIENWISRYSSLHKKKVAKKAKATASSQQSAK
ncbi:336_t:CDS:10 [Scutellospora calospora]|uniref:336_t:CDS:1 n=1 Tax=Scutellospora calospora TaxID=85575 RepID=A0ACA9K2P4_9GLOM|nr:336_t:CDS:10 [Scutellospora calospora]